MNMNQEVVLTRRTVLLAVVAIVAALILSAAFIVSRFEQSRNPDDSAADGSPEVSVDVTPSEEPFDGDMTTGLRIVELLSDEDRKNDQITSSFSRNNFLKMLVSQMGSTGQIVSGGLSNFTYYTEWYIGGYVQGSGWDKNTPWCASYISWCLEQVSLSVRGGLPRYANVDNFITHFDEEHWLPAGATPTPGDLVFFGYMNDPYHMGVVLAVEGSYIFTIEGNSNDVVGLRKYRMNDTTILGYGTLNWTN